MATIGLFPNLLRSDAIELAGSTAEWLVAEGHRAMVLAEAVPGLDLAVSLGGDGTMLRTVDLVAAGGAPVLGVNLGHLGYLTEVGPADLLAALKAFVAGDYRLEERMMLAVEVIPASGEATRTHGLNDAVLQRLTSGHTVRLAVAVSGEPFLTYAVDSLIVATPTGSTAYNLSARGPIASPRARVIVLTPVAAHMLFDRSMLLAADEEISLEVIGDPCAELVVDGQSRGVLSSGDVIRCRAGEFDARLVSFGRRSFLDILKQKFALADR